MTTWFAVVWVAGLTVLGPYPTKDTCVAGARDTLHNLPADLRRRTTYNEPAVDGVCFEGTSLGLIQDHQQ